MSRTTRLTSENRDAFDAEAYRKWQSQEEGKEVEKGLRHRALVILNDDPECEKVIAALEKGWAKGHER